jgi:hypothetical protein
VPDTSGPWDGAPWAEADWYRNMVGLMPSGIIGAAVASGIGSGSFAWSASGLTLTPAAGQAVIGGAGVNRTVALTSVTGTTNSHASFSRRDRLVLRRSLSTHAVGLAVIAGTPAATPVAPALTRDATTFDLPLFSFLVPPNNGTTTSGVVDERLWIDPFLPSGQLDTATSAGRDAIPSPAEGLRVRTVDTGIVWSYDGTSWWPSADSPAKVAGKMWRTTSFTGATLSAVGAALDLDTARVSGGVTFDAAANTLTVPLDGIYRVTAWSYLTGGAATGLATTYVTRQRGGTGDVGFLAVIEEKTDNQDRRSVMTDTVPLKAGDKLVLMGAQYAGIGNGGQILYFGQNEYFGVNLSVEWVAPLNGISPV